MTTLRTRASKGSELTHGELDANFVRDVDVKTTTYSALVTDNRTILECNHATTAFTVTLGDAATMAAAETGDYEITIANIGAAEVTVARAGTDTLDGVATSITLPQHASVTLKVNAATDGYNSVARGLGGLTSTVAELNILDGVTSTATELNFNDGATAGTTITTGDSASTAGEGIVEIATQAEVDAGTDTLRSITPETLTGRHPLQTTVVNIGDWDMNATVSVSVNHGLTLSKIRSILVMIRNDADTVYYSLTHDGGGSALIGRIDAIHDTYVVLTRENSGGYDSTLFDSTSYNRGWMVIQHTA